jgi:hypothetical protein
MKECLLTPLGNRFGNIREAVLRKLWSEKRVLHLSSTIRNVDASLASNTTQ